MAHDFKKSLIKSKESSKDPIWDNLLQYFWPGCKRKDYEDDLHMQKSGVDAIVMYNNKPIWIDFKHRPPQPRSYDDILLEIWSNEGSRVPGWAVKEDKADYYLYLNETNGTCQILPAKEVRLALKKHLEVWKSRGYFQPRADNGSYITVSICVPLAVLDNACQEYGEGVKSVKIKDLDKKPNQKSSKKSKKGKWKDIFDLDV